MKDRIQAAVDDAFSVLLSGLPQGLPLGVVWLAYMVWATVNSRGLATLQSFSRLK